MNPTYRSRSAAVRSAAKSRLAELRAARLARQSKQAIADRDPCAAPTSGRAPDRAKASPAALDATTFSSLDTSQAHYRSVSEGTADSSATIPDPGAERFEVSALAGALVQDSRDPLPLTDDASKASDGAARKLGDCLEPQTDAKAKTFRSAEPEEPADNWRESDLATLPGIGPGLVWTLGNVGVASLADLADHDPAELGARLGLIGELLDLDAWIEEARVRTGRSNDGDDGRDGGAAAA